MKLNNLLFLVFFMIPIIGFAQSNTDENSASYQDWDDYSIDEFYVKVELKSGTKNDKGDDISFVLVPAEMELEEGAYEIEITDGPGDLYEIKGTDYYIEFRTYYGYAGYGEEGVLEVGYSAYNSTFYKKE